MMNKTLKGALAAIIAAGAMLGAGIAGAQPFPNKPVRVLIPFAAGGPLDVMVRAVGDKFQEQTGQQWILEHRPGAGGIIAVQAMMAAPADGYTIMLASSGQLSINPHTYSKLPYNVQKDIAPITQGVGSTMIFAAYGGVKANNLREWIEHAKTNKTSFASFTAGNPSHFSGVILNQLAGIDMLHVPYKGSAAAIGDLLGGRVDTAFLPLLAVRSHLASGKLKALASTGGSRSSLAPEVPTFKEQGFPKLEVYIWAGFVAPAATPREIIGRLNTEIVRALNDNAVRERLRPTDLDPQPMSPEQFAAYIRDDTARWEGAVKASGFKAD